MPPRKEPKETVTYSLGSKRPSQAFKPQRPIKQPRVESTYSQASTSARTNSNKSAIFADAPAERGTSKQLKAGADRRAGLAQKKQGKNAAVVDVVSSDEDDAAVNDNGQSEAEAAKVPSGDDEDSDELPANPLASKPAKSKPPPKPAQKKPPAKRKPASVPDPPSSPIASDPPSPPPGPSQSDGPGIPQPLLVRLMHEHFADKSTKIDKHAIQVLQKYFEVYVREAIARTAQKKSEDVAAGKVSAEDEKWLELEDLEGVAAGMGLDF